MAGPSLARRVARAGIGVVPRRVRPGLFRRIAPLARLSGHAHGLVSLVVVVEGVDAPRLTDTLGSIAAQGHGHREVLLCPVGDAGADAVRRTTWGRRDPRLRHLRPQESWQAAATAGADEASGRWLMFVRGCDLLPPGALEALVAALVGSGSAMAVGDLAQRGVPEEWLVRGQAGAHRRTGRALAPAEEPQLAGDLVLHNRLIALDVWRATGLALTPVDEWTSAPTVARVLRAATGVDVLDLSVVEHLPDHGRRPFGAMPSSLPELPGWRGRAAEVERVLQGTPLADGWRHHFLDVVLPRFLKDAERATDDQWRELRALVSQDAAADRSDLRAEAKSLLFLADQDRRSDVELLARELTGLAGELRTTPSGPHLLARWSSVEVPDDVRRLAPAESPLAAEVQHVVEGADHLEVELLVRVTHLDLGRSGVRADALAADGTNLTAELTPAPAADRWAGSRFQRAALVRVRAPAGARTARLSITAGEVVRSGDVNLLRPSVQDPATDARVTIERLDVQDGALALTVRGRPGGLRLVDEAGRVVIRADVTDTDGVRFVLWRSEHGRESWLRSGRYRIVTSRGTPVLTDALRAELPIERLDEHHRTRVFVGPHGGLVVRLGPPLADDEAGPWAQQRLIEGYAAADPPIDEGLFYFESYAGRSATDSPLAILHELRRRRPDLTTVWGISDHGQRVPEGATPVLLRSRAWYDVLARARCLVVNTDVEAWFRRRRGQVLLQTFHGHPSKGMGFGQWEALDYPPSKVAELRARGVDSWSVILTPAPEMTRHYREQYGYQGPALEHGYPRDDDLVGPGRAERRQETRCLLGIRDDQTAVLYAPTWREHLATRARGAAMGDLLDVEAACRALGDSHVLLLRGHRFHTPSVAGARIIDVTAHPEVNDLILAADVAVLDYSSLRFDFALTGKPMVFLVPDLDEYDAGTRSFLFPFRDSAPGPLVEDTEAVVRDVRDVPTLAARWAAELVRFNATYNAWQDGHASERVVDGLLALLENPTH